ncbi:isocitrate dehydrogenase [Candidatus Hydrogenisulfobacillus filiaventi]|uniref:Isocitrate dehydrogenase [NADP] n=1 Tax=Candidatus Hydrogenisulfobacillus filiaventi TaxID=2707344 RepID=A0A6F8ZFE2_9FIRM|nr:isocitrate dehydrogenase [Candidatus Hydrogenisulfobacillus filiaventi]
MSTAVPGGDIIGVADGKLMVPDRPLIPFIEGDGIGPDIWAATRAVVDRAVEVAYGGRRGIAWLEVLAGEKAYARTGSWLPDETLEAFATYKVGIKGPLTTPVGGGIRSLNVTLRQTLDLYACVRPVRYLRGVPSPMRRPEAVDMVIFRENTEDVYAGLEWAAGSPEARALAEFVSERLGKAVDPEAALGLKPMTARASRRLIARALDYALAHGRRSVTLMHKGNIMKFTEGAFRDWGYALAREQYAGRVAAEADLGGAEPAPGQVVLKDRIADNLFQQVLLYPEQYDVIATPNLNGDYLSDALAAQVGGLGMAPGANLSDTVAVFEATHGTAPKYAGQDVANPGSLILSAVMMLEHLGWNEAASLVFSALERTVAAGEVTRDLARQLPGSRELGTAAFARAVMARMTGE